LDHSDANAFIAYCNSSDAVSIQQATNVFEENLAVPKAHFKIILQSIQKLETFGTPIIEVLDFTEKAKAGMKPVPVEYVHSVDK
jgi:hypothetical protein